MFSRRLSDSPSVPNVTLSQLARLADELQLGLQAVGDAYLGKSDEKTSSLVRAAAKGLEYPAPGDVGGAADVQNPTMSDVRGRYVDQVALAKFLMSERKWSLEKAQNEAFKMARAGHVPAGFTGSRW